MQDAGLESPDRADSIAMQCATQSLFDDMGFSISGAFMETANANTTIAR
jgi:hypothetical protein